MSKYADFISINKNFQPSINVSYDLGSEMRINQYIPTKDICYVLRQYIDCILLTKIDLNKDRATTLVGPYGKGKSFLLLVLMYLISCEETEVYHSLLRRIQKNDQELYSSIKTLKEKKIKLLPVIINSSYSDINQAFMMGLREALKVNNLEDISPNSKFDEAIKIINKWESDVSRNQYIFNECLERHKIKINELKVNLTNCSQIDYQKFKDLYDCVTNGQPFNPLMSADIVSVYQQINEEISKVGYQGIFIIFDEFSKFLESHNEYLGRDLKITQDFAEMAVRSNHKNQLHLCCVTHKSLLLYKKQISDQFAIVEGRFKEVRFNRSLEENYEIISNAIIKDKYFTNYYKNFDKSIYNDIEALEVFRSIDDPQLIQEGCFPLNPLTTISLIRLSEIIAQNERTLFTFISDTNVSSLNYFLKYNIDKLFTIEYIYDYFEELLKKDESDHIKSISRRASSLLGEKLLPIEQKIIKALVVILSINDLQRIKPTCQFIALALGEDISQIELAIQNLCKQGMIRKNFRTDFLNFSSLDNKIFAEEISKFHKKIKNVNYTELMTSILNKRYTLPRRYNAKNKMTRFYHNLYLEDEVIFNLTSFDSLLTKNEDGIIINVLKQSNRVDLLSHLNTIQNSNRVIIIVPNEKIKEGLLMQMKNYMAMNMLVESSDITQVDKNEIITLIEELKRDLSFEITKYFDDSKVIYQGDAKDDLNELLNDLFEEVYPHSIIVNNELINRKKPSVQYQKAIDKIVQDLLDGKEGKVSSSPTSPETTIYNSLLANRGDEKIIFVINIIMEFIIASEGTSKRLSELWVQLNNPPYGIRDGLLSLLFAIAINNTPHNVILYLQHKEIELTPENIYESIKDKELQYYIRSLEGVEEQKKYIDGLLDLFNESSEYSFRLNLKKIIQIMVRYFKGLPNIIRDTTIKNNHLLKLDNEFLKVKTSFLIYNINPYETLFITLLDIFKTDNYQVVLNGIKAIIEAPKQALEQYKYRLIEEVKNLFVGQENQQSTLKSIMNRWLTNYIKKINGKSQSDLIKKGINGITIHATYDDLDTINQFAFNIIGIYIEDWDVSRHIEFINTIARFIGDVIALSNSQDDSQRKIKEIVDEFKGSVNSPLAATMKNNLESILEEYGDAIDNKEKIRVLAELMEELL